MQDCKTKSIANTVNQIEYEHTVNEHTEIYDVEDKKERTKQRVIVSIIVILIILWILF